MSSGEIWHDVCISCRPEKDLAICGMEINPDHREESDIEVGGNVDGQNCVVCMSMECPTCYDPPEDEIRGVIDP